MGQTGTGRGLRRRSERNASARQFHRVGSRGARRGCSSQLGAALRSGSSSRVEKGPERDGRPCSKTYCSSDGPSVDECQPRPTKYPEPTVCRAESGRTTRPRSAVQRQTRHDNAATGRPSAPGAHTGHLVPHRPLPDRRGDPLVPAGPHRSRNLTTERASNIPVESVGIPPPTARPLSDL